MIFLSLANYHIYNSIIEKENKSISTIESVDNSGNSSHLSLSCKNTVHPQS